MTNAQNPVDDDVPASVRQGLTYTRMAGIAAGVFLIGWAPFNYLRWSGAGPTWLLNLEFVYFIVYGIFLVLPWGKISSQRVWKVMFSCLIALAAGFGFLMVIDLIYQYILASGYNEAGDDAVYNSVYKLDSGGGQKPFAPVLQSALIFATLIQVPAVYFVRYPRAMI
ncbi:MAG: hypothetical protein AAFX93_13360 [Verrucomicrobiota bacterium]